MELREDGCVVEEYADEVTWPGEAVPDVSKVRERENWIYSLLMRTPFLSGKKKKTQRSPKQQDCEDATAPPPYPCLWAILIH